ncbi:MAG: single-stranded DNA-binding protein [Oscillochloris sp.]|nr:single-stranded DNA-binding protein [Oscillochloris sp.]
MARDLNKVQLTGRLGADPALRYTVHGSPIITFRVASNRVWRSAGGRSHASTEWFRIVAWDQLAERCKTLLTKGAHVYIEGRLQLRQWVEENGQRQSSAEVVASEVILLADDSPALDQINNDGAQIGATEPYPITLDP